MDPWDQVRRAARDRRSGSVQIALRAARGLAGLSSRRDVLRAARALIRAHPEMAALWRLCAETLEADDPGAAAETFAQRLEAETEAAADAARWLTSRRSATILTHSSSSSVVAALERIRSRVGLVICTWSLPGGEGRVLSRRLEREGFESEAVPDAAIAGACERADLALVGADAVSEAAVVNKVGTRLVALAAREAGIGCYPLACSSKLVPEQIRARMRSAMEEATPLELFDAVVTERGPLRPGHVRRAARRVTVPAALADILPP
ncbi:MAG: hypothetical protein HY775_03580 [Acidobacteria bacterium]|nr:hypothetical protein [Acidobacteriota bacterium]